MANGQAVPDPNRWKALALVCVAFFMVVLDVSIVNVALPSIAVDLDFSQDTLQWVITAYSLAFGGFLLLGGRAADLFGRRKVFMIGMALFTLGSLACGLSGGAAGLIIFRAIQGLGGAIVSPATLAIINDAFSADGAERNKAFGIWGAVAGSGAAAGVLLGGVLTEYLGWEWIFFVNVPIGAAIIAIAPKLIHEGRVEGVEREVDPLAAILVTAGLVIFVYAMSEAPDAGWLSAQTILLTLAAAVLIAFFFLKELRTHAPLVPLGLFKRRPVAVANAVGALLGAALFSAFFVLTLYMQQVLDYSPIKAGVAFLATAGMAVVASAVSQALVTRIGVKPVMTTGMTLLALSYAWYTRMPADGSYWVDLFPAYFASGVGIAFVFIPLSLAALSGIEDRIAGVASGLLNTSQQIGGALGVAIISTVSTTHTESLIEDGVPPPEALTQGFHWAFWVCVGFTAAGAVISGLVLRGRDVPKAADLPGGAPV